LIIFNAFANNQLSSVCHGDHLLSVRFGPAGGLSQPRRDTVDPKRRFRNPFYPMRQSFFQISKTIAYSNQLSNLFSFFGKKHLFSQAFAQ